MHKGGYEMSHSTNSYQLSSHDLMIIEMHPEQAIEVIMDTYGDEIKRLVYTYVKTTADTDDVSQEVFVTVYRKLHTFRKNSSLKSWIYSIAINKCKDHLRSWTNRNRKITDKLKQAVRSNKRTSSSPEQDLLRESESNELIQQIMELSVKYREAIILFYFKDFSIKEIGDMLHTNDATIRTRLFRGREQLKEILSAKRGETIG